MMVDGDDGVEGGHTEPLAPASGVHCFWCTKPLFQMP